MTAGRRAPGGSVLRVHLSALALHPVKSMRGTAPQEALVEPTGLQHDRRWMVVDESGSTVSARSVPAMLSVTAAALDGGDVRLTAAGLPPLVVAPPVRGPKVDVTMSRVRWARGAGAEADAWLGEALGRPSRLVWLDDPARRSVSPQHGGRPGEVLSLADTGPLLLTTVASLRRLDRWVAEAYGERYAACGAAAGTRPAPLSMERFRPNLVVDGDLEPFVEDTWATVRVGGVELRVSELCDRCAVVTLDPETGRFGQEPLRSLARHRRWDGRTWFGIRLVPTTRGTVRVGDPVEVLATSAGPGAAQAGSR